VGLGNVTLMPIGFTLDAYGVVFHTNDILNAYKNTIVYSGLTTFFVLVIGSLAAYALSRKRLHGRKFITIIFTLTMFLSGNMITSYILMRDLGFINKMWAIVIPPAFSLWNIIIFRTNFQSIPESLIESAYIDGASEWRILSRIVLPLSKPILATIGLFAAVGQWNNYFGPFLYLNDSVKFPLSIILQKVVLQHDVRSQAWMDIIANSNTLKGSGFAKKVEMATIIAAIGPIILAYPFVQKYFVKGTLVGSIKG